MRRGVGAIDSGSLRAALRVRMEQRTARVGATRLSTSELDVDVDDGLEAMTHRVGEDEDEEAAALTVETEPEPLSRTNHRSADRSAHLASFLDDDEESVGARAAGTARRLGEMRVVLPPRRDAVMD